MARAPSRPCRRSIRRRRCCPCSAAAKRCSRSARRCSTAQGRRDGRGAESVLPDLRRRRASRRRAHPLRQRRSRARVRARLRERAGRRLGAHATPVRLLARQSDGPRARPRRVARALRALRSLRLRDRVGRVLFGDLFRRSAARRSARLPRHRPKGATASRVSSCSAACPSGPTRPACARATWPATPRCSRRSCSIARITAARCRAPWRPPASRPGTTRRTCARTARSTPPSSRGCSRGSRRCCRAPMPEAAFYLWAQTPIDDVEFARRLLAEENVAVLPGSFVAREANGMNPGRRRVRLALVATQAECAEAVDAPRRLHAAPDRGARPRPSACGDAPSAPATPCRRFDRGAAPAA